MGMTSEAAMRQANIDYINKKMRSKDAKTYAWPGVPLSHFEVTGPEGDVFRAMLADGTLKLVERRKASGAMATFVAIATR